VSSGARWPSECGGLRCRSSLVFVSATVADPIVVVAFCTVNGIPGELASVLCGSRALIQVAKTLVRAMLKSLVASVAPVAASGARSLP